MAIVNHGRRGVAAGTREIHKGEKSTIDCHLLRAVHISLQDIMNYVVRTSFSVTLSLVLTAYIV